MIIISKFFVDKNNKFWQFFRFLYTNINFVFLIYYYILEHKLFQIYKVLNFLNWFVFDYINIFYYIKFWFILIILYISFVYFYFEVFNLTSYFLFEMINFYIFFIIFMVFNILNFYIFFSIYWKFITYISKFLYKEKKFFLIEIPKYFKYLNKFFFIIIVYKNNQFNFFRLIIFWLVWKIIKIFLIFSIFILKFFDFYYLFFYYIIIPIIIFFIALVFFWFLYFFCIYKIFHKSIKEFIFSIFFSILNWIKSNVGWFFKEFLYGYFWFLLEWYFIRFTCIYRTKFYYYLNFFYEVYFYLFLIKFIIFLTKFNFYKLSFFLFLLDCFSLILLYNFCEFIFFVWININKNSIYYFLYNLFFISIIKTFKNILSILVNIFSKLFFFKIYFLIINIINHFILKFSFSNIFKLLPKYTNVYNFYKIIHIISIINFLKKKIPFEYIHFRDKIKTIWYINWRWPIIPFFNRLYNCCVNEKLISKFVIDWENLKTFRKNIYIVIIFNLYYYIFLSLIIIYFIIYFNSINNFYILFFDVFLKILSFSFFIIFFIIYYIIYIIYLFIFSYNLFFFIFNCFYLFFFIFFIIKLMFYYKLNIFFKLNKVIIILFIFLLSFIICLIFYNFLFNILFFIFILVIFEFVIYLFIYLLSYKIIKCLFNYLFLSVLIIICFPFYILSFILVILFGKHLIILKINIIRIYYVLIEKLYIYYHFKIYSCLSSFRCFYLFLIIFFFHLYKFLSFFFLFLLLNYYNFFLHFVILFYIIKNFICYFKLNSNLVNYFVFCLNYLIYFYNTKLYFWRYIYVSDHTNKSLSKKYSDCKVVGSYWKPTLEVVEVTNNYLICRVLGRERSNLNNSIFVNKHVYNSLSILIGYVVSYSIFNKVIVGKLNAYADVRPKDHLFFENKISCEINNYKFTKTAILPEPEKYLMTNTAEEFIDEHPYWINGDENLYDYFTNLFNWDFIKENEIGTKDFNTFEENFQDFHEEYKILNRYKQFNSDYSIEKKIRHAHLPYVDNCINKKKYKNNSKRCFSISESVPNLREKVVLDCDLDFNYYVPNESTSYDFVEFKFTTFRKDPSGKVLKIKNTMVALYDTFFNQILNYVIKGETDYSDYISYLVRRDYMLGAIKFKKILDSRQFKYGDKYYNKHDVEFVEAKGSVIIFDRYYELYPQLFEGIIYEEVEEYKEKKRSIKNVEVVNRYVEELISNIGSGYSVINKDEYENYIRLKFTTYRKTEEGKTETIINKSYISCDNFMYQIAKKVVKDGYIYDNYLEFLNYRHFFLVPIKYKKMVDSIQFQYGEVDIEKFGLNPLEVSSSLIVKNKKSIKNNFVYEGVIYEEIEKNNENLNSVNNDSNIGNYNYNNLVDNYNGFPIEYINFDLINGKRFYNNMFYDSLFCNKKYYSDCFSFSKYVDNYEWIYKFSNKDNLNLLNYNNNINNIVDKNILNNYRNNVNNNINNVNNNINNESGKDNDCSTESNKDLAYNHRYTWSADLTHWSRQLVCNYVYCRYYKKPYSKCTFNGDLIYDKSSKAKSSKAKPSKAKSSKAKSSNDKSSNDKSSNDKSSNDKSSNDKSSNDKSSNDKSSNDKSSNDKSSNDKSYDDESFYDDFSDDESFYDYFSNNESSNNEFSNNGYFGYKFFVNKNIEIGDNFYQKNFINYVTNNKFNKNNILNYKFLNFDFILLNYLFISYFCLF